jgi:phospholipase/carboxylesterase
VSLPPPDLVVDSKAVIWSASEADRVGRPLLILMHGYASDEADLFGLSPYLPLEPVIASVRAPIPEGQGFAWFSRYTNVGGDPAQINANAAARAVLLWLNSLPTEFEQIGLLGFSQGAAMVLQLMRLEPARFSYGIQLSGFVVAGSEEGDAELARLRRPVFWGRGTQDTTIPTTSIERTIAWLPDHSALDTRVYEGMGHAISPTELADVTSFIRTHS